MQLTPHGRTSSATRPTVEASQKEANPGLDEDEFVDELVTRATIKSAAMLPHPSKPKHQQMQIHPSTPRGWETAKPPGRARKQPAKQRCCPKALDHWAQKLFRQQGVGQRTRYAKVAEEHLASLLAAPSRAPTCRHLDDQGPHTTTVVPGGA